MNVVHDELSPKPSTMEHFGDLMTVKDLSKLLGISSQTVYKEIKNGTFGKPLKFGREYRIAKINVMGICFPKI